MSIDSTPVHISHKKRSLGKYWPAPVVLLIALAVTVIAWRLASDQVDQKITALFDQEKSVIINRFAKSNDQKVDVLRTFEELYASYVEVVRDVFELFAQVPVKTYAGIESIAFAPRVTAANEGMIANYAWNLGYGGWKITPEGSRDNRYPILYITPWSGNKDRLGYDFSAEGQIREAIESAITQNTATSTPMFLSPFSKEKTFLFIAPLYRFQSQPQTPEQRMEAANGICILSIPAEKFVSEIMALAGDSLQVEAAVYDGALDNDHLVYAPTGSHTPRITREERIVLSGHTWVLSFRTKEGFGKDINTSLPWIVLGTGVVISFLLFGFTLSLLTSRSRALDLADRMTRSQRRIVDSSRDMIGVLGFDGIWKTMNHASQEALSINPDDIVGTRHTDRLYKADVKRVAAALEEAPDERPTVIEARYTDGNGQIQWISWSVTSSARDRLIYLIGRNITAKRRFDDAIRAKNQQLDLAGLIADRENHTREKFVRDQSMSLRTEMTGILGFLDLVITDDALTRDDQIEFLSTARDSAEALMDIPKHIMEMSFVRISDIAFAPKPASITTLFQQVGDEVASRTAGLLERSAAPTGPWQVNIDPDRFSSSIASIVGRMLRHHPGEAVRTDVVIDTETEVATFRFLFKGMPAIPDIFTTVMDATDHATYLQSDESYEIAFARLLIELLNGQISIMNTEAGVEIQVLIPLIES